MTRTILYITILLLLGTTMLVAQNVTPVNKEIDLAIELGREGKREESIKKCFQLLSSNLELSAKDSIRINRSLARHIYAIGDYENALFYAKKAFQESKINSIKWDEYLYLLKFYNAAEQYDSSVKYLKKIINNEMTEEPDRYFLAKLYNNLGFTYYLADKKDSAKIYYEMVTEDKFIEKRYPDIFGLSTGNLGQIHFENKDYKNALIKMKIDAKLTKGKIKESYNNALLGIAETHLILKNYNESLTALKKFFHNGKKRTKAQMRGLKLIAEVYRKLNQHQRAANYFNEYISLSDSIQQYEKPNKELIKQLSRTRVNLIKKDLTISKNELALIDSELKLSKSIAYSESFKKTIYLVLFGIMSFLAIASLLYFKNRQKKNQKIHKLENDLITAELQNKKNDLNNVVTNLSYKRKFIDQIQEKLKTLKDQPEQKITESINLLIREFNSYKSVDQNMKVLQTDIDKVNLTFFKSLGEKFPLLTENEKELCGLILLKLSSKDIANIRNITPNAVKKARQRIRKKLPIAQDQKITNFLESV
jgi:hypothetical protein